MLPALLWVFSAAAGAQPPRTIERELGPAVEAIYDLRLDDAINEVREVESRYPGHPAGPFYESVIYFQACLFEDPPAKRTQELFRKAVDRTLEAVRKDRALSEGEAHFYSGLILGFVARGELAEGREIRAMKSGRKAIDQLKHVPDDDPNRTEVDAGFGTYYYFASKMKKPLRPFARLLIGIKGDRDKGLKLLRGGSTTASQSQSETSWILSLILGSDCEHCWDEAERLLAALSERYPHNPAYRLRRIYVAERRGKFDEALGWASLASGWIDGLDPGVRDAARREARYQSAEALLLSGRKVESRAAFESLAAEKGLGRPMKERVERRLAQAGGKEAVDAKAWQPLWPRTGLPDPD
jgi:tetratricopeptide (TPR) repeat protein